MDQPTLFFVLLRQTHPRHPHPNAMEHTTKKAADRVNNHREDGEEAIKRTNNVVPIDSGRANESVQVTTDSGSQPEKKKSARGENK